MTYSTKVFVWKPDKRTWSKLTKTTELKDYPEKGKFGVPLDSPPGGRDEPSFHGFYKIDDRTEYWD